MLARLLFLGIFFTIMFEPTAAHAQGLSSSLIVNAIQLESLQNSEIPLCGKNLLHNPDIEKGLESWFGGGELVNSIEETTSIKSCHTYEAAFQTVLAEPGEVYTLRVFVRKEKYSEGAISLKFLNEDFLPIQQDFLPIESEDYTLLEYSAAAPIQSAFVEVNIFQDGGTGCVFADNWCLAAGEKAMKSCKTTARFAHDLAEKTKIVVKSEEKIVDTDSVIQKTKVLNALAYNKNVLVYWNQKTKVGSEKKSMVYQIVRDYIFSNF